MPSRRRDRSSAGFAPRLKAQTICSLPSRAREGDRIAFDRQKLDVALGERRIGAAEGEKAPIVLQQRVAGRPAGGRRRAAGGPPAPAATALPSRSRHCGRRVVPDHRRAAAVAALEFRPEADAVGILQVLEGEVGLAEAQLLALIEADRAAQRHQQRRDHLEIGGPVGFARSPSARHGASRRGWRRPSRTSRRWRRLPNASSTVRTLAALIFSGARKSKA